MGTCSSIYIEFKKRSDKQWHLLEAVVPLDYRDRSYGDDDLDRGEMLEYYLGEEFDEILWLKGFAAGIGLIHEFLTDDWFSEESVRLVFYSC